MRLKEEMSSEPGTWIQLVNFELLMESDPLMYLFMLVLVNLDFWPMVRKIGQTS